jgi:hypothetical protein
LKNIGLGRETTRLQLRLEAQNALNHMNAGQPDMVYNSATMGKITRQNGNPRRAMARAKMTPQLETRLRLQSAVASRRLLIRDAVLSIQKADLLRIEFSRLVGQ